MKVDDLVAAAVADQHKHGALSERGTILDQGPDPGVDLLLHHVGAGDKELFSGLCHTARLSDVTSRVRSTQIIRVPRQEEVNFGQCYVPIS